MLYHRHAGAGAFMRGGGVHLLRHYVQGRDGKPWVHVLNAARQPDTAACGWESLKLASYLKLLPRVETRNASTCARLFERVRTTLATRLDVGACCESLGQKGPKTDFGNVALGACFEAVEVVFLFLLLSRAWVSSKCRGHNAAP